MKALRPLIVPVACFAAAWAITFLVSRRNAGPPPVEPPPVTRSSVSKARRSHDPSQKITGEKLAEDFQRQPMSEWAALWEEFASQATAEELQKLPLLPMPVTNRFWPADQSLLQKLGREELAVRSSRPTALTPESFSALAETDPGAAWRNLEKHNRDEFSTAALRTLALSDPAGTLRRFKTMPSGSRRTGYEEDRAAVWHTPLGSIFGAWARRDPASATAAVFSLPPSDRTEAVNDLAMTWAYHDGPAAIRYLLDYNKSGEGYTTRHFRLDVILRASFRTHPTETAKLMAENAALREAMRHQPCCLVALKPWFDVDPEEVIAWLLESEGRDRDGSYSLLSKLESEPENAAMVIRRLAAAGSTSGNCFLVSIYRRDPELALSLADELGVSLANNPQFERLRIEDDPADACDRWLEALQEHGDPAAALAALGWNRETATALAARAARVFPDKAAALAKLVPASSLDPANLWRQNNADIARFWPELGASLKYPAPAASTPAGPTFPDGEFNLDPATAAEGLLASGPSADEVARAILWWAPHDLVAARAWLARVPEGPARQQGELELAKIQTPYDPVATLDFLTNESAVGESTAKLWSTCLRRVMVTGGDWQRWLARMPEGNNELRESLESEARLLETARNSSRK